METSNRTFVSPVEFILGKSRFNQDELSQKDWVLILNRTLEQIKPRLKYLSGFTEIGHYMACKYAHVSADLHEIKRSFPSDFNDTTRVAIICNLTPNPESVIKDAKAPDGYESQLLITRSGQLFSWYADLKALHTGNIYSIREQIYKIEYLEVRPTDLSRLSLTDSRYRFYTHKLRQDKMCLGFSIMEGFHTFLQQTIQEKQGYLDEMNSAASCIESMMSCIEI